MTALVWCPVCNHRAHGSFPGCAEAANRPQACGCTFSLDRLQRGEADVLAGRVQRLEDVLRDLRSGVRPP